MLSSKLARISSALFRSQISRRKSWSGTGRTAAPGITTSELTAHRQWIRQAAMRVKVKLASRLVRQLLQGLVQLFGLENYQIRAVPIDDSGVLEVPRILLFVFLPVFRWQ